MLNLRKNFVWLSLSHPDDDRSTLLWLEMKRGRGKEAVAGLQLGAQSRSSAATGSATNASKRSVSASNSKRSEEYCSFDNATQAVRSTLVKSCIEKYFKHMDERPAGSKKCERGEEIDEVDCILLYHRLIVVS